MNITQDRISLKWSPVKRFFQMLKLDRKDISYIYIYAIFSGIITLSLPLGIQAIIGLIAGGSMSISLIILILIVTLGTALTGILKVMQLTVTETLQRRFFTRSAFEFAYRIPRLKLERMQQEYPPELVNRFFDTLTLQKGVPKLLMDFSSAILQITFGLILISFYHPFFVFFGVILLLLLLAIFRITGPGGLKTSLKESKYKYEVAHWLEELARSMTTFKLAGGSDLPIEKTDELVSKYLDNRKKHFRILLVQYGNIVGFKTIITGALLLLGSILVIDNRINIGQFVAAEIVVILIMASVEKLILSMETIYDVLTAAEKIGNIADLPLDGESGLSFKEIDTGQGLEVELNEVSFKFEDAEQPTLDNLSLKLQAGEKLCIAGYNSSGKATLIQIITGLHTDFQGALSYNGFPLKSLNLASLRNHIGDHSTKEDIFKGSILENICLGHEDIKLQDVIWAAENVGLKAFIQQSPKGYETILLSGGRNIPRSIQRKIILARSIVAKPKLLTIEGFSNYIQKEDQEKILDFITSKNAPWTLAIVTNNPNYAARCDRIIIMDKGSIIASGTPDEMAQNPHFLKVFKRSI